MVVFSRRKDISWSRTGGDAGSSCAQRRATGEAGVEQRWDLGQRTPTPVLRCYAVWR